MHFGPDESNICSEPSVDKITIYSLTSAFIFSILFSVHLLRCWQGEFVYQSRVSLVGDHFLYFHDIACVIQWWYCKEKLDASHS